MDSEWFWKIPDGNTSAKHSNHFRSILSKHKQTMIDKDPAVLGPFVYKTLTDLGVDPMVLAVHCAHERTAKKRSQTYLGSVMRELCRKCRCRIPLMILGFRVPGHGDQNFKLSTQVIENWSCPTSVVLSKLVSPLSRLTKSLMSSVTEVEVTSMLE
jgi:hypothetical protein